MGQSAQYRSLVRKTPSPLENISYNPPMESTLDDKVDYLTQTKEELHAKQYGQGNQEGTQYSILDQCRKYVGGIAKSILVPKIGAMLAGAAISLYPMASSVYAKDSPLKNMPSVSAPRDRAVVPSKPAPTSVTPASRIHPVPSAKGSAKNRGTDPTEGVDDDGVKQGPGVLGTAGGMLSSGWESVKSGVNSFVQKLSPTAHAFLGDAYDVVATKGGALYQKAEPTIKGNMQHLEGTISLVGGEGAKAGEATGGMLGGLDRRFREEVKDSYQILKVGYEQSGLLDALTSWGKSRIQPKYGTPVEGSTPQGGSNTMGGSGQGGATAHSSNAGVGNNAAIYTKDPATVEAIKGFLLNRGITEFTVVGETPRTTNTSNLQAAVSEVASSALTPEDVARKARIAERVRGLDKGLSDREKIGVLAASGPYQGVSEDQLQIRINKELGRRLLQKAVVEKESYDAQLSSATKTPIVNGTQEVIDTQYQEVARFADHARVAKELIKEAKELGAKDVDTLLNNHIAIADQYEALSRLNPKDYAVVIEKKGEIEASATRLAFLENAVKNQEKVNGETLGDVTKINPYQGEIRQLQSDIADLDEFLMQNYPQQKEAILQNENRLAKGLQKNVIGVEPEYTTQKESLSQKFLDLSEMSEKLGYFDSSIKRTKAYRSKGNKNGRVTLNGVGVRPMVEAVRGAHALSMMDYKAPLDKKTLGEWYKSLSTTDNAKIERYQVKVEDKWNSINDDIFKIPEVKAWLIDEENSAFDDPEDPRIKKINEKEKSEIFAEWKEELKQMIPTTISDKLIEERQSVWEKAYAALKDADVQNILNGDLMPADIVRELGAKPKEQIERFYVSNEQLAKNIVNGGSEKRTEKLWRESVISLNLTKLFKHMPFLKKYQNDPKIFGTNGMVDTPKEWENAIEALHTELKSIRKYHNAPLRKFWRKFGAFLSSPAFQFTLGKSLPNGVLEFIRWLDVISVAKQKKTPQGVIGHYLIDLPGAAMHNATHPDRIIRRYWGKGGLQWLLVPYSIWSTYGSAQFVKGRLQLTKALISKHGESFGTDAKYKIDPEGYVLLSMNPYSGRWVEFERIK